eukprot:CAMPEP_0113504890 /NCGR_PEP_ID=MMETSP0014_2-20120614/34980_1 /TAXON_ID=2857 /ORGANISM="Nitzschia sp." /LENGTH=127 /DNA_ID=CAMNT_0000400077 /DNA_START=236 /DNA_END=616 /DNA_ORIENTATION=+ /assembly_acc=CAM_ASM_000159
MSFNTYRIINKNAAKNDGPVSRQNGAAVNDTKPTAESLWAYYSGGLPNIQDTNPFHIKDSSATNQFGMEGSDRVVTGTIDSTFPPSSQNMQPTDVTMTDAGNQGSHNMVSTNQSTSTVSLQGTNRGA